MSNTYNVIGLMSGTSLDGLDIVYCTFSLHQGKWSFEIVKSTTIEYSEKIKMNLKGSTSLSGEDLLKLDIALGKLFGDKVNEFIKLNRLKPDFVASHGHTVFHQPASRLTFQAGNGQIMANLIGLPVVDDFRSADVLMGGQGAPLVPIGDKLLFSEYYACINLGGIANISYDLMGKRIAFDICPLNMPLNYLANQLSLKYDDNGNLASKGNVIEELLRELNRLPYYQDNPPKSLGYEWVNDNFYPIIDKHSNSEQDKLRTLVEHMSFQIASIICNIDAGSIVIITGGGAYNGYLIDKIRSQLRNDIEIVIPESDIIQYKEALIFGFLGVLRMRSETNVLTSVTGSGQDHSAGTISFPL